MGTKEKNKEKYLGKTILIVELEGEPSVYAGRTGIVEYVDDIGQLHGTWGSLAVIPDVDTFEIIED